MHSLVMFMPVVALSVILGVKGCFLPVAGPGETLVQVEDGWLAGQVLETVFHDAIYYSFKGVPYARPPLGKLRFLAPQPPEAWDGVRSAKEDGPWCPQVSPFVGPEVIGQEDCLNLNVFSPSLKPDKLLPVMFYIHGGIFKFGTGSSEFYGPDFLIKKNVVVVVINYRLDSLGFLSMGTKEVPGNAGLKDQVAALKWVKRNIAKFGGDPNQVTIVGQSAGSSSVQFHILSKMSSGLFNRAISMSGSPFNEWAIEYKPIRRAFILGEILGFQTTNTTELLDFLQNVDYKLLIHRMATVLSAEVENDLIFKYLPIQPVVEKDYHDGENFLTVPPEEALLSDDIPNKVDIMFGDTSMEAIIMIPLYAMSYLERYNRFREIFVPSNILFKSTPDMDLDLSNRIIEYYFGDKNIDVDSMKEMVLYGSFASVVIPVQRYFRMMPQFEGKTRYMYQFSCVSNLNFFGKFGEKYNITGAAHMDDLLYLFYAKALNITITKGSLEYKLIDQETTIYTNFIKYGTPTPPGNVFGMTWPQFNNETLEYVNIADDGLSIHNHPYQKEIDFWQTIYDAAGLIYLK